MKRYHLRIAAVVLLLLVSGCFSVRLPNVQMKQSFKEGRLAWKEAVDQTLQHNSDLSSARFNVTSSARSRDIAVGNYLPSVTGSFQRDRTRTPTPRATKDSMDFNIAADQLLFTGFDTTGKFIKARKDLETSKWAYQVVSATARYQLRSVYVELLRLEKLLDVSRKIEERRRQNAEMIRLRYNGGQEHLGSAMRAEAIAKAAAFEIQQALRRVESQSLLLSNKIGYEFATAVQIEGDLEKMIPQVSDETPDYPKLAIQTPGTLKLIKTAESLKAAVISAQAAIWPTLNSSLDYGYSGTRLDNIKDELTFGFKVSMPFFNGGKNIEGILKARADYEAARKTAESARNSAIAQLSDAWVQLKDAKENVDVRQSFLEAARKRAEIVRAEYTTGLVNFQDFDIAEQDLADSEKAYVQSLSDVLTKDANWGLVKGLTLEDALNET